MNESAMNGLSLEWLENFANQIRAEEREECAKVCEGLPFLTAEQCATAIRMRGEK